MKSWSEQISKSQKHQLYRCGRLAETHNTDYIRKHANEARELSKGHSTETQKRLKDEQDKRFKDITPTTSLIPKRMNRN